MSISCRAFISRSDLEIWLVRYKGRVFATTLRKENHVVKHGEDLCELTAWVFGNEGAGSVKRFWTGRTSVSGYRCTMQPSF